MEADVGIEQICREIGLKMPNSAGCSSLICHCQTPLELFSRHNGYFSVAPDYAEEPGRVLKTIEEAPPFSFFNSPLSEMFETAQNGVITRSQNRKVALRSSIFKLRETQG
jgi:hypothetical protein